MSTSGSNPALCILIYVKIDWLLAISLALYLTKIELYFIYYLDLDSSHEYRSAKTCGSTGPSPFCHFDEG